MNSSDDNLIKKLLTSEEAAHYLNLPISRIRYETFLKRIPHVKIGRSVRFVKDELDSWIKSKTAVLK